MCSPLLKFRPLEKSQGMPIGASPTVIMSTGTVVGGHMTTDDDDVSSACMMSTRTSSMGGAPPLASYEYAVLHVHNESSASGQVPEEEGPGSC